MDLQRVQNQVHIHLKTKCIIVLFDSFLNKRLSNNCISAMSAAMQIQTPKDL